MLAAPDSDIDVFRIQVAVIGPMTPLLTTLVSKDDRTYHQAACPADANGLVS
jgi:esterase/lipase superfamily enzyme